jgi:hypothetical protein
MSGYIKKDTINPQSQVLSNKEISKSIFFQKKPKSMAKIEVGTQINLLG